MEILLIIIAILVIWQLAIWLLQRIVEGAGDAVDDVSSGIKQFKKWKSSRGGDEDDGNRKAEK